MKVLESNMSNLNIFLLLLPHKKSDKTWITALDLDPMRQVTRQHKKDQWSLDEVISHTDVLPGSQFFAWQIWENHWVMTPGHGIQDSWLSRVLLCLF